MSYTSFKFRMPSGFAGDLQRAEAATVIAELIDPAAAPTVFGIPVKMVAGKIQPINLAADTAATVVGFNVRSYPFQSANGVADALGSTTAPTSGAVNVLKRGFIMVKCNGATLPAKQGAVYMRVAGVTAGTNTLGGLEAAADATAANTVLLANCYFNGAPDANGIVELAYNL